MEADPVLRGRRVLTSQGLERLNAMAADQARSALTRCCGSIGWVEAMLAERPFADPQALFEAAERTWWDLRMADWLEAFSHYPRNGGVDALHARFTDTRTSAQGEQPGVQGADEAVIQALADGIREYEARNRFSFIVCEAGNSAAEMLAVLRSRLNNPSDVEIRIAAGEQAKITRVRLEKLLESTS